MLEDENGVEIEIALGTIDNTNTVAPVCAVGVESKLWWADVPPELPTKRTVLSGRICKGRLAAAPRRRDRPNIGLLRTTFKSHRTYT